MTKEEFPLHFIVMQMIFDSLSEQFIIMQTICDKLLKQFIVMQMIYDKRPN